MSTKQEMKNKMVSAINKKSAMIIFPSKKPDYNYFLGYKKSKAGQNDNKLFSLNMFPFYTLKIFLFKQSDDGFNALNLGITF